MGESLSAFVRSHEADIVSQFSVAARSRAPGAAAMSRCELRDDAEELLAFIVDRLSAAPSAASPPSILRGLTAAQTVMELEILRATVLRMYESTGGRDDVGVERLNRVSTKGREPISWRFEGPPL
jgi:hypothetical protein